LWENARSTERELFGFELSVFDSVSSRKNISVPRHAIRKSFSRHFSRPQQTAYNESCIPISIKIFLTIATSYTGRDCSRYCYVLLALMKVSSIYVIVLSFSNPVAVRPLVSGFVAFSKSSTLESVFKRLRFQSLRFRRIRVDGTFISKEIFADKNESRYVCKGPKLHKTYNYGLI
jgi:hypothetical protein